MYLSMKNSIKYIGVKYIDNFIFFNKGPNKPYLNKNVLQIIARRQQIATIGNKI